MSALGSILLVVLFGSPDADNAAQSDRRAGTAEAKVVALDEFSVKAGGVTFNNLTLGEGPGSSRSTLGPNVPGVEVPGLHALTLRGTFRNPTDERLIYTLLVCGLNTDGEVEWSCHFAGIAERQDVGIILGQLAVHPGTLKQTPTIRVRARVGAVPLRGGLVVPHNGGLPPLGTRD